MKKYYFSMALSYERYLPFYQGVVKKIQVKDSANRTIELPAEHFRSFVTRDGIHGDFELCTDNVGKFISLQRIN